jgi:carboxypeptidase C (cathepsin A)
VGVGFSWSGNEADYSMGDWDAARDNFAAIQVFLTKFPGVAQNDFYATAESYGGHYMPTLAKFIVDHQPNNINFKGFAVGNPFTSKVRRPPPLCRLQRNMLWSTARNCFKKEELHSRCKRVFS